MKKAIFAGGVVLALTMLAPMAMSTNDVFALDSNIIVTETQLNEAIETAEQAISKTQNIDSVSSQRTYLQNLVARAKEIAAYFYSNQDQNLDELVAALNEGARGIILISGIERVAAVREIESEARMVVEQRTVELVQATTASGEACSAETISEEIRSTEDASRKAETNQVASSIGVSVMVVKDEPIDEPENPLGENENVEVPKTGEEDSTTPSSVAVAITAGVAVFVSAAGTAAIVKRLKRDA